ncbi:hypothetical protein PVE_R1G4257 [Pseudomonas veronii 1YdBTEX2]|uniref:Uncharacterized protein n=1 Tax=Pseudomonas veronii 1YdBTEX2 TaxID=1295141 RepID=A0A1D3K1D4_PSEVE|nr:hypothetical protein PVE_R1G4257 [Pseudomonas veronii 1YdBTEX2]
MCPVRTGFSKVTRRKGGTHSSRDRSNGYVLNSTQKNGRPRGRHRGQAPSHIWSEVSPISSEVSPLDIYPL